MKKVSAKTNKPKTKKIMSPLAKKEAIQGYIGIMPWLIGFLCFTTIPLIAAFCLSFTYWDILTPIKWAGLNNFKEIFQDEKVLSSLWNTFRYTIISVPLTTAFGLLIALMMNQKIRGILAFRIIYYLPAILPATAVALLWIWILNPDFGIINTFLSFFGITGPAWLSDPKWAMSGVIIRSCWGVGGGMILFLAALQNVPATYYEAAKIDGGNAWHCFKNITLPMISPTLFFFIIEGTISALQEFTLFKVMTDGGPIGSTTTFVLHLYDVAFGRYNIGYASALSWIIFFISLALTWLLFRSSRWVYYEGEGA